MFRTSALLVTPLLGVFVVPVVLLRSLRAFVVSRASQSHSVVLGGIGLLPSFVGEGRILSAASRGGLCLCLNVGHCVCAPGVYVVIRCVVVDDAMGGFAA